MKPKKVEISFPCDTTPPPVLKKNKLLLKKSMPIENVTQRRGSVWCDGFRLSTNKAMNEVKGVRT